MSREQQDEQRRVFYRGKGCDPLRDIYHCQNFLQSPPARTAANSSYPANEPWRRASGKIERDAEMTSFSVVARHASLRWRPA
jgi:hypothetical protein